MKLSFKMMNNLRTLESKFKLRQITTTKPTLQKILKRILYTEAKTLASESTGETRFMR